MKNMNIYIRIIKNTGVFRPGQVVKVRVDRLGTALGRTWRRRMHSSKIDNAIRIIKKPKNCAILNGGEK